MGYRTLLLGTLAALAVGYGLTRQAGIHAPSVPSVSEPKSSNSEEAPGGEARGWAVTSNSGQRIGFVEHRSLSGISEGVDWPGLPIPVDIEYDGPPIDLGERLDVNDDWGAELALQQEEPIDIGVELDASDPLAWESEAPHEPPVAIGAPLDPDDAEDLGSDVAAEEPMEIGPPLDVEDPPEWEPDETTGAPGEIGDLLVPGAPLER